MTSRAAAQRRTLGPRISCFREECLEQAGEEICEASVAAKAIRRSRSRPTKPFEETVMGVGIGEVGLQEKLANIAVRTTVRKLL